MGNGTGAVINTPDLIFTRSSITLEYRSQAPKSLEGSLSEKHIGESGISKLPLLLIIKAVGSFA